MAASVFPIGEKVFGVSYQTAHFRHVRRVIDSLREEFDLLMQAEETNDEFENSQLTDLEKQIAENLKNELTAKLQQLKDTVVILAQNLSANILSTENSTFEKITRVQNLTVNPKTEVLATKVTRAPAVESEEIETENIDIFDEFTPIDISQKALENAENWDEEIPIDL